MIRLRTLLVRATLCLFALTLLAATAAATGLQAWREERLARLEARSAVAATERGAVEYAAQGSGPAVLVLHGGFGGFDQGLAYLPGLPEAGFRIIAPSRPGYLRTPLSTGETDAQQADAMAALLDGLGVRRAAVVGISAGGPVAVQFALRHPERTSALVLACAITRRTEPRMPDRNAAARWGLGSRLLADIGSWRSERATRAVPRRAVAYAYRMCDLAPQAQRARLVDEVMADPAQLERFLRLADSTVPLGARLPGLRCDYARITSLGELPFERVAVPTLVVHGTADKAVGIDHAEQAAARIPGATFCRLEGADHLLMLGPHRHAVTREVVAFLGAHTAAADKPL